eukprot:c18140_g1_i1 orf=122-715(+)
MGLGRLAVPVVVLVALLLQGVQGTTWRVGDSKGWQLNVDYGEWVQGKVFEVGDVLLFIYNKTTENVLEVSQSDYGTCTTVLPIANYTDGNSSVPLNNLTTRFFISGIPGHCVASMTLEIKMGVQSPPPAPAMMPASAPTSPSVPYPTPSPPPSSLAPPISQVGTPSPLSSSTPQGVTVLSLAILLSVATSSILFSVG